MRVSYSPGYYAPIPDTHVFPMRKFEGLHAYLLSKEIIKPYHVLEPQWADKHDVLRVHTNRYVQGMLEGTLDAKEIRKLGLPWSYGLAQRSFLAAQGTINASLMALQDGISGNLAGGTHHAMPDGGEGFCVFNDVAIAIQTLSHANCIEKALIIDCDVHQGNGNAHFFAANDKVFTFSMHGEKNYPFKKPPSDLDIHLPDGTDDETYHRLLIDALDDILARFTPDLVYYLGGIDVLKTDRFGRLALSLDGLRERDRIVLESITQKGYPLVLLLSGGYAPTLQETVIAHAQMFELASEVFTF